MERVEGAVGGEIKKFAWDCICYLIHFNDNVKNMKDYVQKLAARSGDTSKRVEQGRSDGGEVTQEVDLWLKQAADMKDEAEKIEQREDQKCLFCPDLWSRYIISKQAKEMVAKIDKHLNEGNFQRVTMRPLAPKIIKQIAPSIEGFRSVESSLEKVMIALGDENSKIIGVWGMGGVGKTTLVKIVNNRLGGTQQFHKVIMVTVSECVDIKRIQGEIAKRLDLILKDETESLRASDLSRRLEERASDRSRRLEEKTFLIILDDLWERLVLADVGIPSPTGLKGSKIIFTTRSKDVCKGMESQVDIQVDVLLEEESWKLFKEKAGDVVDDPSLNTKAMEVFKECAGLPLAIITLGRALRGERNPRVWDNALSQMKKAAPRNIKEMEKGVYQSIKISYERLQAELKAGFLFCCLFPEDFDIHVDSMICMWKGEGFLEEFDQSLEEALNKGHAMVEELKSSCLLLAGTEEGYVKMHDIVRDVAIWISSNECKDYKSFVRIGQEGLPQKENWEEYERISLMGSGINKLPEGMHCSKLLTLMMSENKKLTEIQGGFFEATKGLRVLDLSKTAISKIPLSNQMNLRVLCLSWCRFEEGNCLSAVGGLKQLEFLDLSFNESLRELPNEIGELVNLRSLDLTATENLEIVPSGVISRLTLLEELKMLNSFMWEVEGIDVSSSSSNASLSEVASLKRLSYLHLDIVEVERFPRLDPLNIKHWTKLRNFNFRICTRVYGRYIRLNRDDVKCMEFAGCSLIPKWAIMLLPHATHLRLQYCKGGEALIADGGLFPSLEELTIEKCDDVEFVVSAKGSSENAFRNLRSLKLRNLRKLKKVVTKYEEGLIPRPLLRNLEKVKVKECPELKHLLTYYLLQGMDNLTEVKVQNCKRMEHVFDGLPTMVQRNNVLSKLKTLDLSYLPRMTSIWPVGLEVKLENLTTLTVSNCHGLKNVLKQIKDGFPNLVELSVVDCEGVEEIISDVEDNEGLLPKLRILNLWDLPKLVRICGGEAAPLLQLEEIRVLSCGGNEHVFDGPFNDVFLKLKTSNLNNLQNLTKLVLFRCHFFEKTVMSSVQINGGLPNLVKLAVDDCRGGVEEIISDVVNNEGLLPKLEVLVLRSLPELVRIYGGGEDTVQPPQLDWHSLKEIYVYECPKLKKLQPLQGGAHSVPLLQKIEGETEWWEGLDWDGDAALSSQFHRFFEEKEVTDLDELDRILRYREY